MHLRVFALASLASILALAGCDSNPAQPTCTFTLSATSMTMGAAGGSGSVTVTTGNQCAWAASSGVNWITATGGTAVTGPGAFTFNVAALTGTASRTGSLTVAGQAVSVTQQGVACAYTLLPASRTVDAAGATAAFDVNTDAACAWTAAPTVPWLSVVSGGSGSGNAAVTYRAAPNPDAASRTGSLTVGGQSHTVTQTGTAACDYSVAPVDVRACMSVGYITTITVSTATGCPWTSSTPASWITIASGISGTGPGTITFSMASNFDAARQANVEVRWPTPTAGQNVRVAQAGCNYGVSKTAIDVPAAGGDFSFDVISSSTDTSCGGPLQNGCVWSAVSSASWVTVLTQMPSNGDNRVSIRVAANGTGAPRTATIVVRDRTVTVRQS